MALGAMSPTTLNRLIRIAIEVGGAVTAYALDQAFADSQKRDTNAAWPVRKLHVVWSRTGVGGVIEDSAVCTFHFVNFTNDAVDVTWTDDDFLVVETAFDAFWTAMKSSFYTNITLDQYRWYRVHPGRDSGQPVRVVERNVAGTGTGTPLPPQVAQSVTEKTYLRRRWGRFYLPAPVASKLGNAGDINATHTAALADAAKTMYEACRTADIMPVVYSEANQRAFEVSALQVDNVFDVIRSRRYSKPTIRELRPTA